MGDGVADIVAVGGVVSLGVGPILLQVAASRARGEGLGLLSCVGGGDLLVAVVVGDGGQCLEIRAPNSRDLGGFVFNEFEEGGGDDFPRLFLMSRE